MATIGNLGAANSIRITRESTELEITLKNGRLGNSKPEAEVSVKEKPEIRKTEEAQLSRESSDGRVRVREIKQEQRERMSVQELEELLRKVNLSFDLFEIQATYTVDNHTGDVSVQIINQRTGEVIRKIPPYEVPRVAQALENGDPVVTDVKA